MRRGLTAAVVLLSLTGVLPVAAAERPQRPVHTYSIVARDAETGELGVAVQSHWFSVGPLVAWAEPGVGAVATQSFVDPAYGPLGLELMRGGKSAAQALAALLAADEQREVRQVGMVDATGNVANHTGAKAIAEHCQFAGEGYTVQANLMWRAGVCEAMRRAYAASDGDLAARLLAALKAAQDEGGDIRGQQSAALLVVGGERTAPAWSGRRFDLRVDDHRQPLVELERLLTMARAYRLMNEGDEHMANGDIGQASAAYRAASALVPGNHEMIFWHAATLAAEGLVEESLPLFRTAFAMWPQWRELVERLPASGLLPDDPELIRRIQRVE